MLDMVQICTVNLQKKKIRKACGLSEDAEIFFLVGGTQTNATVIKRYFKKL